MKKPLILLNAGHGGSDSGALGPNGLREADVVLRVCQMIAAAKNLPFRVVLIRATEEEFFKPSEIARRANKYHAKAFISVHCNSAETPASGIETFCARRSANGYRLAESLHEAIMGDFADHTDRGVKRANFTVLTKTRMPAALVELEFIHTVAGELHLGSNFNQDVYAQCIITGILDYLGIERLPDPQEPEEPASHAPCRHVDQINHHAKEILRLNQQ